MVHGKNRIPYRIDRRLTGLAGRDYAATISFGLPFEPGDSQYGEYRVNFPFFCNILFHFVNCGAVAAFGGKSPSCSVVHAFLFVKSGGVCVVGSGS